MNQEAGTLKWNQHLGSVLNKVTDSSIWDHYELLIKQLVPIDDLVILLFQRGQAPELLHYFGSNAERRLLTEVFIKGLYVLDPFYKRAHASKWGFVCFNDILPEGFYEGDLFKLYYKQSQVIDEVGFMLCLDDSTFIYITTSRFTGSSQFSATDKKNFRSIEPLIQSIVNQFWYFQGNKSLGPSLPLHEQITEILDTFGSSLLTDREMEVIHRILNGYSAQAIANNLEISVNTVKLHRKNAYAKLDISSQNELFHMFLDSLSCVIDSSTQDPLIAYLQVPEK